MCWTAGACMLQMLEKLVYGPSSDVFDAALTKLQNDYPSYYQYLLDNWIPSKELFAAYCRVGKPHWNIHTNNRIVWLF